MTITEALAEIKTIGKRITKKREFVSGFLFRQEMVKDPLEKDGGTVSAIRRERQAIADLEARVVALRLAIQKANTETQITVGKQTRSIADWIVWRREVAPGVQQFLGGLRGSINKVRQDAQKKGVGFTAAGESAQKPDDIIVNISEQELAGETEALEETLGSLDGQLSLKNATVLVTV